MDAQIVDDEKDLLLGVLDETLQKIDEDRHLQRALVEPEPHQAERCEPKPGANEGSGARKGNGPDERFYEPPGDATPESEPPIRFKDGVAFMREYAPISYTINGTLPSASLYFLTGPTGHGKTVLLLACMFAIALNRPELIGVDEVEPGHVAYVALENPTDIRMKMTACAFAFNVVPEQLAGRVTVIDQRMPTKEICDQLTIAAEQKGPMQAVFYDTFQAGFDGASGFNDNLDMRDFTVQLRMLTQLPGRPSVLVAAHPCKNAGEGSLQPYGGGAVLNEADGNLTLWKDDKGMRLHWSKVRGPHFEPRFFRIEMLCTPDVVDNKGRQISLPVPFPMTEEAAEQKQEARAANDVDILRSFDEDPTANETARAITLAMKGQTLQFRVKKLAEKKFLELGADRKYRLTTKGRKELRHISPKTTAKGDDDA
jgi:hypothetical protein